MLYSAFASLSEDKIEVIPVLVYSRTGSLVLLLSLDPVPSPEKRWYGSIVAGITASCDTPYNWAFFLLRALSLLSPAVTSALMFFSVEPRLAPSFPFLSKQSLHCRAVIGLSAGSRLWAV